MLLQISLRRRWQPSASLSPNAKLHEHHRHQAAHCGKRTGKNFRYRLAKCDNIRLSDSKTPVQSEAMLVDELIDESFGTDNFVALIVPAGNYDKERRLLREIPSSGSVR